MNTFLVLIHSIADGSIVRQFVTDAETAEAAAAKYAHVLGDDVHALAIPTGSVPDATQPAPAPAAPDVPAPASVPAVADAEKDGTATPDAASLVFEELTALPPEVLAEIIVKLRTLK